MSLELLHLSDIHKLLLEGATVSATLEIGMFSCAKPLSCMDLEISFSVALAEFGDQLGCPISQIASNDAVAFS